MNELLNIVRRYDFRAYIALHEAGGDNFWLAVGYELFAKYGIIIIFLSFIYLIWNKRINALICSFLAMGLGGLADLIIFVIWSRPRPFVSHEGLVNPDIANFKVDISSFPSSHTYIAFAVAVSVFLYGHKKLGTALWVLAFLIAAGRVGAGLHYPSDILGGVLLGISAGIFAYIIVHRAEKAWEV